jgi:hypothetical protein
VREYVEGDDPRSVDWNVTARIGRPFVKRFVEERELTVVFALDLSASMQAGFGAWSLAQTAARFCALLGLAAIANNDRVGLVAGSSAVERFVLPRKGAGHVLRIVRDCLLVRGRDTTTNLRALVALASSSLRRRAVVFLISDFLDIGHEHELRLGARRHDLVAVRLSPRELVDPPAALLRCARSGARAGPARRSRRRARARGVAAALCAVARARRRGVRPRAHRLHRHRDTGRARRDRDRTAAPALLQEARAATGEAVSIARCVAAASFLIAARSARNRPRNRSTSRSSCRRTACRSASRSRSPYDGRGPEAASRRRSTTRLSSRCPSSSKQRIRRRPVSGRRYRARAYVVGEVRIPAIEFRHGGVVATCTTAPFVVKSVLGEPPGDVEWPGDIREWPQSGSLHWWLAVLVAALLGGVWWWRRPAPAAVEPERLREPQPMK